MAGLSCDHKSRVTSLPFETFARKVPVDAYEMTLVSAVTKRKLVVASNTSRGAWIAGSMNCLRDGRTEFPDDAS